MQCQEAAPAKDRLLVVSYKDFLPSESACQVIRCAINSISTGVSMAYKQKSKDWGSFGACVIGASFWLFIASEPSPTAWIIAALVVAYAILGYMFLMLHLDEVILSEVIRIEAERSPARQLEGTYKGTQRIGHGDAAH
jgi:hypothetical protein